jgi:hypothetical protein
VSLSPEVASTIGLSLDLVGALLIGFEFFKKYEGDRFRPDSGLGIDYEKGFLRTQSEVQPTDEYRQWGIRRERVAKVGLALLCIGFGLQILANWL